MAYLSKQLATIKLDVELNCSLEDCEYSLPFNKEAYLIMQDLDFKSLLNRKELFAEKVQEKASEIKEFQ